MSVNIAERTSLPGTTVQAETVETIKSNPDVIQTPTIVIPGGDMVRRNAKDEAPASHEAIPDFEAAPETFANKIAANMCAVFLEVKRPAGNYKIGGAEVMARGSSGEASRVGRHTKPGFIIDEPTDHTLWYEIDQNTRAFKDLMKRYSATDKHRKGFHLVPMSKTGRLFSELRDLRRQRLDLVSRLRDEWDLLKANLKNKYPNHWHLLEPSLPEPDSLVERFDAHWIAEPLTPISAANLSFQDVNDEDRMAAIDESNKMVKRLVQARAKAIYDEVFGEILEQCDKIKSSGLKTGRLPVVSSMMDMLERLKNFSMFIDQDTVRKAEEGLAKMKEVAHLQGIDETVELDREDAIRVREAITTAFKPVGEALTQALRQQSPEGGKARRRLR